MLGSYKRMWVSQPKKRIDKTGKAYWTFYISLGKWTKGKKAGLGKGFLNCVCYLKDIELTDKQELLDVVGDLVAEQNKDNKVNTRYYKLIVNQFKTLSDLKSQPDIDEIPELPDEPMEEIPELDDGKEVI